MSFLKEQLLVQCCEFQFVANEVVFYLQFLFDYTEYCKQITCRVEGTRTRSHVIWTLFSFGSLMSSRNVCCVVLIQPYETIVIIQNKEFLKHCWFKFLVIIFRYIRVRSFTSGSFGPLPPFVMECQISSTLFSFLSDVRKMGSYSSKY